MIQYWIFGTLLTTGTITALTAQTGLNTTLIAQIDYDTFVNDVWGYTDAQDNDYAIVGLSTGIAFVQITDDIVTPVTTIVEDETSIWRDIKTHSHYAYVTNESGGGLDIYDLATLPASVRRVPSYNTTFSTAHNLYIADGFAYISGSNISDGADILDLADPEKPVRVGVWNRHYFHDIWVRNDTLFGSAGNTGSVVVLDVTDKAVPRQIAEITLPDGGYAHNAWGTADGRYLITTQETQGLTVKMWDISNLDNPMLVHTYLSFPSGIAHNAHIRGDYAYISHYGDGLRILDISEPTHMVEVGFYDTVTDDQGGFEGNWGAFPFTRNGYIYASDESNGLFVVKFAQVRAGRLFGTIRDDELGTPVAGLTIAIPELGSFETTAADGSYKVGFPAAGSYQLKIYSFYYDTTRVTINTEPGDSQLLDLSVVLKKTVDLTGTVSDAGGIGINEAQISLVDTPFQTQLTGIQGDFLFPEVPEGQYHTRVGKWRYRNHSASITVVEQNAEAPAIVLEPGYIDDFELDLGWQKIDEHSNFYGNWQIINPAEIGISAPLVPKQDTTPGKGMKAYYGRVFQSELQLVSPPMDLTEISDPLLSYRYYWVPRGENGDSMLFQISNNGGIDWTTITAYGDDVVTTAWQEATFSLPENLAKTTDMRIRFSVREQGLSSCFALIDDFNILDNVLSIDESNSLPEDFKLEQNYPNPFNAGTSIKYALPVKTQVKLRVFNLLGKEIKILVSAVQEAGSYVINWHGRDTEGLEAATGVYFYRLETDNISRTMRMMLIR